jgi:hypothetical protein
MQRIVSSSSLRTIIKCLGANVAPHFLSSLDRGLHAAYSEQMQRITILPGGELWSFDMALLCVCVSKQKLEAGDDGIP